ncbi:DNA excision repair protein ERCC-1-like [Watersipora subatra]|uniref:DNA excision repair protein ERCC-1-like n=1 Tax=Watersipora subatra TaxID=2589382 RepID=UPI00355B2492
MAKFTVPSFSDDDWETEDDSTSNKRSLFERRKEQEKTISKAASKNKLDSNVTVSSSSSAAEQLLVSSSTDDDKQSDPAAPPAPVAASSSNSPYKILVNTKQKGNPILKMIRNVPWEFSAIIPDYELGKCSCALYLSVRYHNRFPNYIHTRLKELGKSYELRILLVQVDTRQQDISHELNQLSKICILADCTMILAFSHEEAGRYLEVYKAYESKPPTDIMVKSKTDFLSQATEFLTAIKGVNKTDVTTLLSKFKTIKAIIDADVDSLSLCPGIGPVKARRLQQAFTSPFLKQRLGGAKHELVPTSEDMTIDVFDDDIDAE